MIQKLARLRTHYMTWYVAGALDTIIIGIIIYAIVRVSS